MLFLLRCKSWRARLSSLGRGQARVPALQGQDSDQSFEVYGDMSLCACLYIMASHINRVNPPVPPSRASGRT